MDEFQLLLGIAQPAQQPADAVQARPLAHPGPLVDQICRFLSGHAYPSQTRVSVASPASQDT